MRIHVRSGLDLSQPPLTAEDRAGLEAAKQALLAEGDG